MAHVNGASGLRDERKHSMKLTWLAAIMALGALASPAAAQYPTK
jgi:hypothetical protein